MERFVKCREQYRAPNLIGQGLPEAPNVEEKVQEIFPRVHPLRILEIVRLSKPREAGQWPRPVLVRFASARIKHEGLKEARALHAKRIYLDTHLTPRKMAVNQAKASRFHQLRDEGAKPVWRGERLQYFSKILAASTSSDRMSAVKHLTTACSHLLTRRLGGRILFGVQEEHQRVSLQDLDYG